MTKFKNYALIAALCLCVPVGVAAQTGWGAAAATMGVALEPADDDEAQAAAPSSEDERPAAIADDDTDAGADTEKAETERADTETATAEGSDADATTEEAEEETVVSVPEPEPAPEPQPEITVEVVVEPEPEPEPEIETATVEPPSYEKPEKTAKVHKEKPIKPAKVKPVRAEEVAGGACNIGLRAAMGVSAFHGHKAIRMFSEPYDIQLGASHSASIGLSFAYDISELLTIAADAQYSVYTAYGSYIVKQPQSDFGKLNEAGVELHTVELPILARFNISKFYAEAGAQLGGNLRGRIFANSALRSPFLNDFAVGPAAGVGIKAGSALVGVRGYYNLLEYAENSNSKYWTVQAGITKYFKNF